MLDEELASKVSGKVVVVGVGDAGHGDDGVGPMVAQMLAASGIGSVIDAGSSPEIETWRVREACPDTVVFVDAVDLGRAPGDVALLEPSDLRAGGADTHRAPLRLTMEYLERDLGARCYLLAVQPKDVRFGVQMCEEVRRTGENLARMLGEQLESRQLIGDGHA